MNRSMIIFTVLIAATATASADRWRDNDRPAFLDAGIITRHYGAANDTQNAFRTDDPSVVTTSEPAATSVTGDFRFGMRVPYHLFLAGEVEFGRLADSGSNVAGAYGVVGARFPMGSSALLTAELATGYRSIRYTLNAPEIGKVVMEPRVRAEIWIDEQFSLGATLGATLDDRFVYMAGLYLGIHSHTFGGF